MQKGAYDELQSRLVERVETLRLGPGWEDDTDIGPVINRAALEKIDSYTAIGKDEGAKLLTGGEVASDGDLVHQSRGKLVAERHVRLARVGADGEAGRHRKPENRHLGEVCALAAEQVFLIATALFERVDVLRPTLLRHHEPFNLRRR